jgi:transposase
MAVDTLGHLLAWHVTPANEQDRTQVAHLTEEIQAVTENSVEIAFTDQGYTGDRAAQAAAQNNIDLVVVKLPEAKKGFVLLPKRWVVERSFAWTTRFRRLVEVSMVGKFLYLWLPHFVVSPDTVQQHHGFIGRLPSFLEKCFGAI